MALTSILVAMEQIAGLSQFPLSVSTRWITKSVATRPPRLPRHDEYRLVVSLASEEPILIARVVEEDEQIAFGRERASAASKDIELRVDFFPYDWHGSDKVQINFGGLRVAVSSADLKHDPRNLLSIDVSTTRVMTGSYFEIARLDEPGPIRFCAFVVLRRDVMASRGRWRFPKEYKDRLPPMLGFLAGGWRSGRLTPRTKA